MQKILTCLWFNGQAEHAVKFYTSIFNNSKILNTSYYGSEGPGEKGTLLTAVFQLNDQEFMALNGGPVFKFNEAISLVINCKDQAEVDYYWEALTTNGGEEGPCGWCKDKYGLSWQVVPTEYFDLIHHSDPAISRKALMNTFKQKKLIISELK